ncbi:MAG TPA: 2-dehydropantoate 2-reductase [bacterium]|nr:2-dehydropantoate 2-reductase [bacterium]
MAIDWAMDAYHRERQRTAGKLQDARERSTDAGRNRGAVPEPIVIVGAGAIGGTIGAHLARQGRAVLLVDAARDHVEAVGRDGLHIEGRDTFTVRVPAVTPDGLRAALGERPARTVMLAVKAQHTAAGLDVVAPILAEDGYVVSMQNGLNERAIAARLGAARTVGAFINFGADYHAPGRIMYGGPGALYLGELNGESTPRVEALGDMMRDAFLPNTTITRNIWGYLWGKMGYASMLFATAVVDETMAAVLGDAANEALLANLAAEVTAVAEAEDVRCEAFDGYEPDAVRFRRPRDWAGVRRSLDALVEHNRGSLKQKSGIWRDLAVRRRRTEVDSQIGEIVKIGQARGMDLPLNVRLIEMIHDLESGNRTMHPDNLAELRRLNDTVYPGARR